MPRASPIRSPTLPVPTRRPVQRVETDKRQQILDAALKLMVERGFHGTAMPQIAAAAQVGVGTIYRYFADKEALGNTLYRSGKLALGAALWGQALPPLDWRGQFQEVWQRLVGFARREPLMLRFLELHYHASYLDAESLALEESAHGPASDYLQRAISAGAVRRLPPALLVDMVWAMLIAVCANLQTLARPDLLEAAGHCAWAAIANP